MLLSTEPASCTSPTPPGATTACAPVPRGAASNSAYVPTRSEMNTIVNAPTRPCARRIYPLPPTHTCAHNETRAARLQPAHAPHTLPEPDAREEQLDDAVRRDDREEQRALAAERRRARGGAQREAREDVAQARLGERARVLLTRRRVKRLRRRCGGARSA